MNGLFCLDIGERNRREGGKILMWTSLSSSIPLQLRMLFFEVETYGLNSQQSHRIFVRIFWTICFCSF